MSYDLLVFAAPAEGRSPAAAYRRVCDGETDAVVVDERVEEFWHRLQAEHPELDRLPVEVPADPSAGSYVLLGLPDTGAEALRDAVRQHAEAAGLVVYDPQAEDAEAWSAVDSEEVTGRLQRVYSVLTDVDRDDATDEDLRGAVREALDELDFIRGW